MAGLDTVLNLVLQCEYGRQSWSYGQGAIVNDLFVVQGKESWSGSCSKDTNVTIIVLLGGWLEVLSWSEASGPGPSQPQFVLTH